MTEDPDHRSEARREGEPGGMSGAETGWAVVGTLLAGIVVWGGLGWLVDQWLDTRAFIAVGVILGVVAATYLVVVKYGK
jgi:F0F1-type ATP synthase assembly protein I